MKTVSIKSLRPGHDASAPIGIANVRQHDRTGGIEALADSIAAHGLIAPLVVVSGPKGVHFVADGNRRLAALELLVTTKRMKGTDTVAVVERTAEECAEIGLAANVMRAPLHDADRYVAFANLAYLRLTAALTTASPRSWSRGRGRGPRAAWGPGGAGGQGRRPRTAGSSRRCRPRRSPSPPL